MKQLLTTTAFLLISVGIFAQPDIRLLPFPQNVEFIENQYFTSRLSNGNPTWEQVAEIPEAGIHQEEAYRLYISAEGIRIEFITFWGALQAGKTLRQLTEEQADGSFRFPFCKITDWAAFRIRGVMQDVGRTYISIEELKREIDLMAAYKLNVFHWHLTEDIAWRLESKRYPQLNQPETMIRQKGMFYTQEEARDLVRYCHAKGITLIPEIDMPGHSEAFRKAIGHDMQSPEGMAILKEVMDEVCEVFDVPYIHIGTDEVAFTNPDFVPEMVAHIRAKGKKVISWNPGWKYQPGEIDMTQLWSYRGKAQPGIPAIDSRFHYVNHFDAFGDIVALYQSRIANSDEGNDAIAGAIFAVWHDRYVKGEKEILRQNNFYPNMLAFAERAWRGGGFQYFDDNGTILKENTDGFAAFADFEERLLWQKDRRFTEEPFDYVKQTDVRWRITDPFPNGGNLGSVFPPEKKLKKQYSFDGKTYQTHLAIGSGIYLRHVWGKLVPSFYENPPENHTAYAYTYVYSPVKQTVGLWAETQNYSRSEKDLPPPQGAWDYRQSAFYLNGKAIEPPVWTASHTEKSNETPLGNENFTAREPIPVTLEKGWNKVLVKLPVGKFTTPEVRLVKWMFTFAFVTPDGKNRPDGLIYSPDKKKK
ncbi:MAG: family 20 glycosylhydrolase [Capnocytophaga sp.]|nr:family 20 glycosylhydrolase [Capnocytophaga sp.]